MSHRDRTSVVYKNILLNSTWAALLYLQFMRAWKTIQRKANSSWGGIAEVKDEGQDKNWT